MKRVNSLMIVSAIAALALVDASISSVNAGPNVPRGHYCLTYDTGGSDCGFTSYSQCLATASGIDGECYGKTVHDDDGLGQYGDSHAEVARPAHAAQTGTRIRRSH
jgi:Protein of unknown function (DUF3551)